MATPRKSKSRPAKKKSQSGRSRSATTGGQKVASKSTRPTKATKATKRGSSSKSQGRSARGRGSASKSSDGTRPPRLQKVLASAGVGSRRDCEVLILEGRVEIDRRVVTELGVRVDPQEQEIRLDGDILRPQKIIYYAVHKPTGVVSTNSDPAGRMRVVDLVPPGTRLFTVGRLDKASQGLMLVTNDGELANRLAHPRYNVEKIYLVSVVGHPSPESLKKLRHGVHLADGVVRAKRLRIKGKKQKTTILEMVLTEGRNREIRRMAAAIGHKVTSLQRIAIGPLRLGDMPSGAYRPLTSTELKNLKSLVTGGARRGGSGGGGARSASSSRSKAVAAKRGAPNKAARKKAGSKKTGARGAARTATKKKSAGKGGANSGNAKGRARKKGKAQKRR